MPDFLHLNGLRTLQVDNLGDHYRVEAEGGLLPTACPTCSNTLYRHGSQRQSYMDTPMHGKRALIEIDRKRYRCKACGKTLFEPLPAMDSKRQATSRLITYIESHCTKKTFADLSREVGVDDKTIRRVFDDYVARKKETVHFETPEILGIDELKIIGQYRAMVTNVGKLALYDMLPTRNKADLIAYFKQMPDKAKVKMLTMDLWNVYRQVAHDQFPGRLVVADRFHVVRMANNSIEAVRKTLRKSLPTKERIKLKDDRFVLLSRQHNLNDKAREKLADWIAQYPILGTAYAAKEAFHDIYRHTSKADAQKAAEDWERSIDPSVEWAFREAKVALRSWWAEIFNYYDHPITNGYTESVNNLAKGMNRMGRGYSFDVIPARLLYDSEALKDAAGTVRKKVRKPAAPMMEFFYDVSSVQQRFDTVIEEQTVLYGAYIPHWLKNSKPVSSPESRH